MAQQRINPTDVGDAAFDLLAAIGKWLAQVAAIAVGTCLGITLFVMVVGGLIAESMPDVKFDPFPTTTTTWNR